MASAIMANAVELTVKENTIVDIGAWTARGEQDKLGAAFKAGFDAGLTLNEAKELVGQLYAYCGFPRALNAAGTLMKVWNEGNGELGTGNRKWGEGPAANMPRGSLGERALPVGTANQTKLCGGPVKGALFDFHPQLDEYLKTHLFGDIFARDNIDWRTREIVTIAALEAWMREIGVAMNITELGATEAMIPELVKATFRLGGGYKQLTEGEVAEIFRQSL